MNFWAFSILLSTFIYSLIFDKTLIAIYFILFLAHLVLNTWRQGKTLNSVDRKIQISTWDESGDPSVFGRQEFDVTNIDKYINNFNEKYPGSDLGYLIVFAKAMSTAFIDAKKLNGKISFGQFILKDDYNVTVFVNSEGINYGTLLLESCNKQSIKELNDQYKSKLHQLKKKYYQNLDRKPQWFDYIPSIIIKSLMALSSWISYDWGCTVPILNMNPDHYGYGILTDLSSYGVVDCTAPLVPFMKSYFAAVINKPSKRAMYIDGNLVIRNIIYLNLTYDHRFGDGADAMKMMDNLHEFLNEPAKFLDQ